MAKETGLGIPNVLTGLTAFLIILFGPSRPVWYFPLYLLLLPVLVWLTLWWLWRTWQPSASVELGVRRVVAVGIAAGALIGALLALNTTHHYECSQAVRAGEDTECIGDFVIVAGPDKGLAFGYSIVAFLAIRFAMKDTAT